LQNETTVFRKTEKVIELVYYCCLSVITITACGKWQQSSKILLVLSRRTGVHLRDCGRACDKNLSDWFDLLCLPPLSAIFQLLYIMATSFSGGRSRSTRREPPTMGKQLVNFITCDCESSAPYWW